MSYRFPSFLICLLFYTNVFCQNAYPIILIHGFLGWGRDEMSGYYYWGGKTDLETGILNAQMSPPIFQDPFESIACVKIIHTSSHFLY